MARQTSRKSEQKDAAYRSSLTLPAETAAALLQYYRVAAPRDEGGKELSFGRWLAETALSSLDKKEEKTAAAPVVSSDVEQPGVKEAAARGAAAGVIKGLEGFAGDIGRVFGARLIEIEQRLGGIEALLNSQEV